MNQQQKTKRHVSNRKQASRPTIGMFIDWLVEFHQIQWLGAVDAARAHHANLITFTGRELGCPDNFYAQANVIYDLVSPEQIDGLVIWTTSLQVFIGRQQLEAFCQRYHPLPIVSVEQIMTGLPSLLMDNKQGMAAAVSHLIEMHGYRRIAFIRGPADHPGAQERYQGYVEALTQHGLPLDPSLVSPFPRSWLSEEATSMVHRLLDEHPPLSPSFEGRGGGVEAIAATADNLALGVLSALQARQIRVPHDMAVVGFDNKMNIDRPDMGMGSMGGDTTEADVQRTVHFRDTTVPLTTVQPPFYELGWRAVELLLAQLRGEEVPEVVTIPTELIVRRSCGCFSQKVRQIAPEPIVLRGQPPPVGEIFAETPVAERESIITQLKQVMPAAGLESNWADRLLTAFIKEMQGESADVFLTTLDELVHTSVRSSHSLEWWWRVLFTLRRQTLPYLLATETLARAEFLWQRIQVLMEEITERFYSYQQALVEQRDEILREIGQKLITTFDLDQLAEILAQDLPNLGIERCYLALYESRYGDGTLTGLGVAQGYPTERSRAILVYEQRQRVELKAGEAIFPSKQLAPGERLGREPFYSLVVEPLYFRDQQLGFGLFEVGPREGLVYEALRGQLSSALQGALLVEREKRALAEGLAAQQQTKKLAAELATVAEVSTAAATILETNHLLQTVVDLTKASFGLYHVHIYLLKDSAPTPPLKGGVLVLAAGAGEVGRQMVAQGWSIPFQQEQSLVARTARTRQGDIINNVWDDPNWLPNPLLPHTCAELAVPLLVGEQVLGVLEVQADQVNYFSEEDVRIQSTLAAQVAVAIHNAQLYHEAAEARQAAETANRAKSEFLANMSHELRTPLNGILGYAQILKQRQLEANAIRGLNIIQQSGEHLLTLINDILDLAKIEAHKLELRPVPIHFPTFLDSIVGIIRARTKAKGLVFTFEPFNDLPAVVQADETRLRQVLLNLLGNAVKFTDQGTVTLRVKKRDEGRGMKDENLVTPLHLSSFILLTFEVEDTGPGIPPDQIERIFQPFEQVGDVGRRVEGTGLGLAISRQLVQLMGSDLHVKSEPGRGSTFWFEVALAVTEIAGVSAQPSERIITGYQGRRRQVLVVDDILSNRAMLVELLEPLGFELAEAENGWQALELARVLRPDLILMDRRMPVLDGFSTVRQIRQLPHLQGVPIIAISASVSAEDRALSREVGYDAFLSKPINWPKLAALLAEYLTLEWEYTEKDEGGTLRVKAETKEIHPSSFILPPSQEELTILYDLALRGNMRAIRERAIQLEQRDATFKPFARHLQQLAEHFEEQAILLLIEQYRRKDNELDLKES